MRSTLHLGFFEDFKGGNTLLLEGQVHGLAALSDVFRSLAAASLSEVALHDLPFVEAHGITVVVAVTAEGQGIQRSGSHFSWSQSPDDWLTNVQLIAPLLHASSGHQYLGSQQNELTVMVSIGEYEASLWSAGA